jgi:hypothetical protein
MSSRVPTGQTGQATVELVAMIPLLFVVVLAAAQLMMAGAAGQYAGHAAEAAAVAVLEGGDPVAAARASVPDWSRADVDVSVHGERVRVAVRPRPLVPPLAKLLTTHAEARAGG